MFRSLVEVTADYTTGLRVDQTKRSA